MDSIARISRISRACCLVVLGCFSCILFSCGSSSKNVQLAQNSVGVFHAQLDTEQYNSIYAAADERFRQASTEADFLNLVQAIHIKLGTVQESTLRNSGIAWHTGTGTTVTLLYYTRFSGGTGTEEFVWHIQENQATLYGYHINSTDLIRK